MDDRISRSHSMQSPVDVHMNRGGHGFLKRCYDYGEKKCESKHLIWWRDE